MVKYQVLDNERPANKFNHPKLEGEEWRTSVFKTLHEAVEYAEKWLGEYFYPELKNRLLDGIKVDYSGAGDTIQIVRID